MKNNSAIFAFVFIVLCNGYVSSYAQTKPSAHADDTTALSGQYGENNETESDSIYLNSNDTIQKYKRSRDFAYMAYLDSALRKESRLKNDTVNHKESTGRIIRERKPGNDLSVINRILNGKPLQIFFWTLAVLFILLVSYRLLSNNMIFKRSKDNVKDDPDEEHLQGLADVSEYDVLIAGAEETGNYNLAVRYLFLKMLKNLSDKEIITFTPDKTNSDYIKEIKDNVAMDQFRSLVYNYEYLWYGKFSIDDAAYRRLKDEFYSFNQKLSAG